MKNYKLFIGILFVFTMITSIVVAEDFALPSEARTYDKSNEVVFDFVKGWNFVPFSLSGQINENSNIQNRCGLERIMATFIWDSVDAKYFGWSDASDINSPTGQKIGTHGPYESWSMYYDKYLELVNNANQGYAFASNGAGFFYAKESCKGSLRFNGNTPGRKLVKNANFISIDSWMIGKSPKSIFANCLIEKINTWSNSKQEWTLNPEEMVNKAKEFQNDETPVDQNLLGIPFVIYVTDACEMQ